MAAWRNEKGGLALGEGEGVEGLRGEMVIVSRAMRARGEI